MDIQTVKLDLINWLINLKDEAILSKIKSLKNNSKDQIDMLFQKDHQLQKMLDNRLKEKATDFSDAKISLNKIREQYGL